MALTVLVAILMLVAILGAGILIALLIERIFDLNSY